MNLYKSLFLIFCILVSLTILVRIANAQTLSMDCHWDSAQYKVVCTEIGSDGTGGSDTGSDDTPAGGEGYQGMGDNTQENLSCDWVRKTVLIPVPNFWGSKGICLDENGSVGACIGRCMKANASVNPCTGTMTSIDPLYEYSGLHPQTYSCGGTTLPPSNYSPTNPCNISASWTGSGFTASCNNNWECTTAIPLPPTYIDVRPYPVTLVRWPTAIRCSGQGISNNSCLVSSAGEMRNLSLSLEFRPASGIVTVTLPYLPAFTFNASSPTAQPILFRWDVPSHPAVGANRMAGTLNGFFDEIPGDFPVFSGQMSTPYRLYWTVSFQRNETGNWVGYSFAGELLPQDVRDLPLNMIADLNGDGNGDAYWDPNFIISRMDENNRTDNPLYERHWSYGSLLPWAVREGQGQIGWPGVP